MEAVGETPIPVRRGPSAKTKRVRGGGGKSLRIPKGSRVRQEREENGWICHSQGWSPKTVGGKVVLQEISAPSVGLGIEAFTALVETCGIAPSVVQTLFRRADVDENGTIDFPEMISTLSHLSSESNPHTHAKEVFLLFDKARTGLLPTTAAKELIAALHFPPAMYSLLMEMLRECGGFLPFASFTRLLCTPQPTPPNKSADTSERKSGGTNLSTSGPQSMPPAPPLGTTESDDSPENLRLITERLRPLSVDLEPLLPVSSTDPRKGGGGRRVKVTIRKAEGLAVKGGGMIGTLFGGGSAFRCNCELHLRGKRAVTWKSKVKGDGNKGDPEWNETFSYDVVPLPAPHRPAPPLALLLRGAVIGFKVTECLPRGERFIGEAECRLDQLKEGHVVEARYKLMTPEHDFKARSQESAINLKTAGTQACGQLFVTILLEATSSESPVLDKPYVV